MRHPDCQTARQCRDLVSAAMRKSLEQIQQLTTGEGVAGDTSPSTTVANGDSGISLAQPPTTAYRALKELEVQPFGRIFDLENFGS